MTLRLLFILVLTSLVVQPALAQIDDDDDDDRQKEDYVFIDPQGKKGFMFGANIGMYLANDFNARFYDGTDKGEGFLDLSEFIVQPNIQQQILAELGNGISSYSFAGFPSEMNYNRPLSFGLNLRYQFDWYSAIVADFNFITLTSSGLWAIQYPPTNGTAQNIFQNFEITGKEERLSISTGYHLALGPPENASLHFEFGPQLSAVKVRSNQFKVGSRTYNILRAQSLPGNQLLNNRIPTLTSIGAYAQFGTNLEFDKFTLDLGWRTSLEKHKQLPEEQRKSKLEHHPFMRLVYRLTIKGF